MPANFPLNTMLTDQEIIKTLAEFAGCKFPAKSIQKYWNPLKDWNDWRMVELKVLKNTALWVDFESIMNRKYITFIMCRADLPARCNALIQALDNLKNAS